MQMRQCGGVLVFFSTFYTVNHVTAVTSGTIVATAIIVSSVTKTIMPMGNTRCALVFPNEFLVSISILHIVKVT